MTSEFKSYFTIALTMLVLFMRINPYVPNRFSLKQFNIPELGKNAKIFNFESHYHLPF